MTAKKVATRPQGLTVKQEPFCVAYVETGNASEAYRRAYDAGGMKPASINRKAKELMDNGKIAARLAELRKPAADAAQITLESHLERLDALSRASEAAGQMSAAITAEIARGKASGVHVEKMSMEHAGPNGGAIPVSHVDAGKLSDATLQELLNARRAATDGG